MSSWFSFQDFKYRRLSTVRQDVTVRKTARNRELFSRFWPKSGQKVVKKEFFMNFSERMYWIWLICCLREDIMVVNVCAKFEVDWNNPCRVTARNRISYSRPKVELYAEKIVRPSVTKSYRERFIIFLRSFAGSWGLIIETK